MLDYDNDGWFDIYMVNGSTFDMLKGTVAPYHAALSPIITTSPSQSYESRNDQDQHFSIGDGTTVDAVEVHLPAGTSRN